jgi:hypothetical protein
VFAALLMVVSSVATRAAASSGGGGSGGAGGSNNSTSGLYYPYAVPASLYPTPANLSLSARVEAVASVPFPGASSAYAVVVASTSASQSGGNSSLVLWEAAFSPQDARSIALNSTCGEGCGQLPLSWSNLSRICTLPGPVADVELVAVGSMLVVAATSEGYTYLFSDSLPAESWSFIGPVLPGTVSGLSGASDEVAIATTTSTAVYVATVAASGATLGEVTVYSTSSNLTGPVDASVSLIPEGAGYSEVVVYSIAGSDHIEVTSSSTGSQFSTPTVVGNFSTSVPDSLGVPLGQTVLSTSGGEPGQLVLTAVGSELFLLFTTDEGGQTVPMTAASGNGGVTWDGPYLSGAINGSALNPAVTSSPAGLVYAAWTDPDYGTGAIEEAEYLADGMPILAPETVGSGLFNGTVPTGPATLAVDSFQRPLLLWPSSPSSGNGSVAYTGAYLGVSASLNLTEVAANLSLGEWDLKQAAQGGSALASLGDDVNLDVASVDGAMTSGNLCAAQNLTALSLYSNLTHVALSVSSGLGTVCAATFVPDLAVSPLLNATGIDEPNTYLAVYLDWALEAEGVPISASPLTAVTQFSPYALEGPSATLPSPVSNSETVNSSKASVTVTPTPYSPSAYDLVVSDSLPTWSELGTSQSCNLPDPSPKVTTTYTTSVTSTWTNVSIDNGTVHTFNGTTSYPSVWIYDLPEDQGYSWSATVYATTSETREVYDGCTGSTTYTTVSPVSVGPKSIPAMTVRGSFATTLSITYASNLVTAAFDGNDSAARLSARFNATLPATENLTLSNATTTQSWSSGTPTIATDYEFPVESGVNRTYTLSLASESRAGSSTAPGSPTLAFSDYGSTPPEDAEASCQFTLTTPTPKISNGSGGPYASLNASTVNVTWNSSADVSGFFTYYEVGSSINWTVSGIVPTYRGNETWSYEVEIHGLEPLVAYNGTFGVSWDSGCLVEEDHVVVPGFETESDPGFATDPTLPLVWEHDQPYDSIAKTGGGIVVGWNAPANPPKSAGTLTFVGGYVRISGGGAVFRLDTSQANETTNGSMTVGLDPALTLNQKYTLEVFANYTYEEQIVKNHQTTYETSTDSASGTLKGGFTYEQDTSLDGLTDTEKQAGWIVPLAPNATPDAKLPPYCIPMPNATQAQIDAIDQACAADPSAVVTADPSDYSTNGLVNDYVEKELDLNPNTIDTAGSHMLDTWNLTFIVGLANTSDWLPSQQYFHYYYENQSYSFAPASKELANLTNLTCLDLGATCEKQKWVGDSLSWASTVLWTNASLWTPASTNNKTHVTTPASGLEAVMKADNVGWLRAVTGHYGRYRIITVWGKLSWGANPVVQSTSGDGLPDGSQVNPLGPVAVTLNLTAWREGDSQQSPSGAQFAPFLTVTTGDGGTGTLLYQGYAPEEGATGLSAAWYGSTWGYYQVSLPIPAATGQDLYCQVELYVSLSSKSNPYPLMSTIWQAIDLLNIGQPSNLNTSLWQNGSMEGWLALNATVSLVPPKANTLLVTPAGNATLSPNLPWGLKRYVGETDFDLLVLNLTNDSRPVSVSVPWANGSGGAAGADNLTLEPGLNNLLVPRGIFLNSPLGQALLNSSNASVNVSLIQGPAGSDVSFDPQYWANRTLNSSDNLPNASNPNFIWVFSNTSQLQNGSTSGAWGGIPGSPLESGNESREVQSVVWVNVTPSSNAGSAAAQLRDLFEGLILNLAQNLSSNASSWNISNDIVGGITSELPTLGLPSIVMATLANATIPSNGSYGPPQYNASQASPSGWQVWGEQLWNTITGVATWVVDGVTHFASAFWSVSQGASAYIGAAVKGALVDATHGLTKLANQSVSALKAIEEVMEWALNQTIHWISANVLGPVVTPIITAADDYGDRLYSDVEAAESDVASTGEVPASVSDGFWQDFSGSLFVTALTLAAAVVVGLNILATICLGVGVIVSLVLNVILTAVMVKLDHEASPSFPKQEGFAAPTGGMVELAGNITNTTPVNNSTPDYSSNSTYPLTLSTIAQIFSWNAGLFGLTLAWGSFCGAFIDPTGLVSATVGLAAAIVSIILALVSITIHTLSIDILVVCVSGLSFLVDYNALSKPLGKSEGNFGVNLMSAVIDGISLAIGIVEVYDKVVA